MLFLRCSHVDRDLLTFADELRHVSNDDVVLAVDENNGPVSTGPFAKLSVTSRALKRLDLYVPRDAGWRCGDYILYLALHGGLATEFVWLIEYDVRITNPRHFFSEVRSNAQAIDFLAADLRPAAPDWYWWSFAQAHRQEPQRCFFPLTRYSRAAIELLFETRQRHSRDLARRAVWPNDEAFTATTLLNSALVSADFNEVVASAWSAQSFSYSPPIRGETFRPPTTPYLWHPVLFGKAFEAKLARAKDDSGNAFTHRLTRRLLRPYLRRASW